MAAEIIPQTKNGIILEEPISAVEALPGFAAWVMFPCKDGAAQLSYRIITTWQPKQHVLDACSAPGGKLLHMLESQPDLSTVIAVEKDAEAS